MRSLSDTLHRLQRYRTNSVMDAGPTRLKRLEIATANPGNLLGWYYPPETNQRSGPLPLVVVLHGCTQTAAGYDAGSGWSKLADEFGFAVLFPEQSRQNNPNLCFNWFSESHIERDRGEVRSIREMIDRMVSDHGIDPKRVFITGLSAGGAMANAMLAAYPEVFSGGAIIAGLPYGVASSVPEAFDRMRGHGMPCRERLQERLRLASTHVGPWPTISVWHGAADKTVDELNARAIIEQWKVVHEVADRPARSDAIDGYERHTWTNKTGADAIELHRIGGMGHGTPIDTSSGYGSQAPYMLDVGISSTEHIARSWGLTPSFERRARPDARAATSNERRSDDRKEATSYVQDVIESALRSAGLMR
ncbi:PHB depolymerase family esterase [Rhizobium sp. BK377]|uniref:extracellular catalytic domain type 1 short-chain-length polyhydroxyalkanoate depolymerase n=1 Tax=Rhizobium sp. BK377 TaxID=2587058 RepID=UPI0016151CB2|nr:PHB depolymerase family esterase [Rhizobium sp. BK377]MBB3464528.1 poly(hydroxyalkanoate) depolymerase family esterase [Rhizobium sp. BK377]